MEEKLRQKPANCLKIVLFGPESTGKTTLSRKLATHYSASWIPEFARDYLQEKWNSTQQICAPEDLLPIARGQMQLENEAAAAENKLLFCDTDLLETKVYGEAYYDGWSHPKIAEAAAVNTYDLYLLTYIDTPWEADDLRDRPAQREEMFLHFAKALVTYKRPYVVLTGTLEQRMKTAINLINTFLS